MRGWHLDRSRIRVRAATDHVSAPSRLKWLQLSTPSGITPSEQARRVFGTLNRAEPGQVLVSNVVRELCAGKQFTFEPLGDAALKGFNEPVALYEAYT